MSINKQGQLTSENFISSFSVNNATGFSFIPAAETNNSCETGATPSCNFSYFYNKNRPLTVQIELDFIWTDFTGSGNNGTFNCQFQGMSFPPGGSGEWSSNYITYALNMKQSAKNLILNSLTGGSYHYSTIYTIPASWFDTYDHCNLGMRFDYANGTGRATVSNIKITPIRNKASIGQDYINSEDFYEY